ncbi:MAG: signal peptidase II [Streptococcaceae bacterium]|jgi:signal peptidase II|nr:signal peptidase II [Streptococcaceae bacterium]
MKKILSLLIIGFGILFDQLVKNWVVQNIAFGTVKKFIPGIMSLTRLTNSGAAWSMLEGQQWLFNILTPIAIVVALYFLWKKQEQIPYNIALSLIISGALGNWIDRIRQGFVVDMFQTDFINFAIFNVADALLSIGFVLLILSILFDKDEKPEAN